MINKEYKSTVFAMLFGEPEALLSLYNAINNTDYTDTDLLSYCTLEDSSGQKSGIFSRMRNDLSFVIASFLNLYEHQSTLNNNMSLRMLFYCSTVIRTLIQDTDIYGRKQIQIPAPVFLVFYNGTADMPEETIYRLSDAYELHMDEPQLELKVKALNINAGKNVEIAGKCKALKDYIEFVDRSRKALKGKKTQQEK